VLIRYETLREILKREGYRTGKDEIESTPPMGLPIHIARPPERVPSNPGRPKRHSEDERRTRIQD